MAPLQASWLTPPGTEIKALVPLMSTLEPPTVSTSAQRGSSVVEEKSSDTGGQPAVVKVAAGEVEAFPASSADLTT